MLLLGYYRRFIVIYMYLLLGLFLIAITWDTVAYCVDTDEAAQTYIFAKTITALFVVILSYLALCLNHYTLEKVMKMDDLRLNRIIWLNEFLKRKRRLKPKMMKKGKFFLIHFGMMLLVLLPLIIGECVKSFDADAASYFHSTGIAIAGCLLKSASGFITLISSEIQWSFTKKRKLVLA